LATEITRAIWCGPSLPEGLPAHDRRRPVDPYNSRVFVVPLIAGLVGVVFGGVVLREYLAKRKPYQLAWAFALELFGFAALIEAVGIAAGWTDPLYKSYYLLGGILNVGWLAVGELYLLFPRRVGLAATGVMAAITLAALVAVSLSSTDPALLRESIPARGAISAPAAPVFPLVTNLAGSVILIGGAAWSAWTAYRRSAPWSRVLGVALIAAGAFVVAGTHSVAQARGLYAVQPLGEAIGILVMFAGYLSVEAAPRAATRPTAA
jgi:hypothetical protein